MSIAIRRRAVAEAEVEKRGRTAARRIDGRKVGKGIADGRRGRIVVRDRDRIVVRERDRIVVRERDRIVVRERGRIAARERDRIGRILDRKIDGKGMGTKPFNQENEVKELRKVRADAAFLTNAEDAR